MLHGQGYYRSSKGTGALKKLLMPWESPARNEKTSRVTTGDRDSQDPGKVTGTKYNPTPSEEGNLLCRVQVITNIVIPDLFLTLSGRFKWNMWKQYLSLLYKAISWSL